jgi:hypothetical protein
MPRPDPPETDLITWVNKPASGRLTGVIFTDGSSTRGQAAARAGWSAVQVDAMGYCVCAVYGPCPLSECPHQSSPEAEDYAVKMVAALGTKPVQLYSDCANTVAAFQAGRGHADGPNGPRAHLWGPTFASLEPEDGDATIYKVKGHATAADVRRGLITEPQRRANDLADYFARLGADKHEVDPHDHGVVAAAGHLAVEAARWHTLAAAAAVDMGDPSTSEHDGLGVGELAVEGEGDLWVAAGLPGGPPTALELERLVVGGTGPWRVRGHTLYEADVVGHGKVALICDRCGCSGAQRARTGGLRSSCQGPAAPGLASARSKLERNLFPAGNQGERISELRPPSVATRRQWVAQVFNDPADGAACRLAAHGAADPPDKTLLLQAYGIPLEKAEAWASWGAAAATARQRRLDAEADEEDAPARSRQRGPRGRRRPPPSAEERPALPQTMRAAEGRPPVDLTGMRIAARSVEVDSSDSESW